ncbi:ArsR family transcriptional regulator [Arthrobacter crystallopoietes BAB-32]|uniref:ArsR family transcriptional regulator n=1 Tax=Arthrobacter crystallopoietes BAB-32 TaxID=1246476 RepID=N1UVV9_9MICC|nr:transcriptional regulator [Arthrobacter crystallopoietes]EMY33190.1 ArsR family transcriptional regulator [Arthrobacter crystallopoietes BAB-32]
MGRHSQTDAVTAVAALADPSRRSVYEFVLASAAPVSRDDVAGKLGMVRGTAAFHLDRLAREELLTVSYRRLTGRSGPGSGRPTKLYAPTVREVSVSLPQRHYDFAAELLAAAVEESTRTGKPVDETLSRAAAQAGAEIGSEGKLEDALAEYGYQPVRDEDGSIIMRNCPFHRLSKSHTATVCGMNLDLLAAATAASEPCGCSAVLDPAPGRCCVRILPPETGSGMQA